MIHFAWLDQLEAGIERPGQIVADQFGVSRSTVHRALARSADWLSPTGWPPPVPHGFGLSAADRRRVRLRAQGVNPYENRPIVPSMDAYQIPAQWQDQPEDDAW
jgi:hypothetical protein